jgi:hypothetical protein
MFWLSVSKFPLKCAVVSLYSVVKQRLKCDAGEVFSHIIKLINRFSGIPGKVPGLALLHTRLNLG